MNFLPPGNCRHLFLIAAFLLLSERPDQARAAEGISPLALAASTDGKNLYVAEAGAKRIAVFDVAAGKITGSIPLPEAPTGLAPAADGSALYVTLESPRGQVFVVHPATGNVEPSIPAGHTPTAPVLSPDGKLLYVCNKFNNNVSVIETATAREIAKIPVQRQPVAAAITPDGQTLFVANLLPVGPAIGDYVGAAVSVIDTASKTVTAIKLLNGSSSVRGICVSPDGRYAYAVHVLGHFQLPTTQLERGWMNTSALSVIDVAARKLVNTALLDDVDLGAANPWSVVCTGDGRFLCVTHAGTHEISLIDRLALHAKLEKAARGEKVSDVTSSAADVPTDLAFLLDLRRRLKLAGNGPRGLAVIGDKAYAAEYFTDSLGIVDIQPDQNPGARSTALGPKTAMSLARKGEMYFHDAEFCFQKWQSCSSCHPDGRVDALNWDLLNDGIGNPKNTKNMLWTHRTPPAMSLGSRETAEEAVRAGLKHIQLSVRPEEDAKALDEYLKSLTPVPSPYLVDGQPSNSAKRGKKVFDDAGCITCHAPPLFTDLQEYDLKTGTGVDAGKKFDTPTLVEVWRTAPFLHDGWAATLMEVITTFNKGDTHGITSKLSAQEKKDLVEYVLSL